MPPSVPEANRIDYIDGLRGVAILGVVLFHAYARWTEVVPYGSRYSDFVIFKNGWLGVYLFFVISGFVITMTLSRTKTLVRVHRQAMEAVVSGDAFLQRRHLSHGELL